MKYLKYINEDFDFDFLNTYHKKLQDLAKNVKRDLPNMKQSGKFLSTTNFSEVGLWNISRTVRSSNLVKLAEKITYMMNTGNADNIYPMLKSIANNTIKTLYQPYSKEQQEKIYNEWDGIGDKPQSRTSLGKGHFKWNYKAITLSKEEINIVKKYFNL